MSKRLCSWFTAWGPVWVIYLLFSLFTVIGASLQQSFGTCEECPRVECPDVRQHLW